MLSASDPSTGLTGLFGPGLVAFVAIFVALDVVGTVPMFVAMTRTLTDGDRKQIVNRSMAVALATALVFVFFGQSIFAWLGIQLFDFKIAGGIVLLLVALADLVGGPGAVHGGGVTGSGNATGIVPLAVPLITGPGVLTTLMLQVANVGLAVTLIALLANYFLAWVVLHQSQWITRVVGRDGTVVVSKIAALLLAAIAIAMVRSGIFESIRAF